MGIDWFWEFKIYLEYLIKGLHQCKAIVQCIFKVWDEALFPDTTNSLAGGRAASREDVREALDALNADDVVDSKEEGSGQLSRGEEDSWEHYYPILCCLSDQFILFMMDFWYRNTWPNNTWQGLTGSWGDTDHAWPDSQVPSGLIK